MENKKHSDKMTPSTSEDDKIRIKNIFDKLDSNHDGYISFEELSSALENLGIDNSYAREIMKIPPDDCSGRTPNIHDSSTKISLTQFGIFVQSIESRLKLAFNQLDLNKDNYISSDEVMVGLNRLGIGISHADAKWLLSKINRSCDRLDQSDTVDFKDFRDFFLLSGGKSLREMVVFWHQYKPEVGIDSYGEGLSMIASDQCTDEDKKMGAIWKMMLAGAVSGFLSRTATAPLDRLKVTWQAHGVQEANKGFLGTWRDMIKEGGYSSLWRGNLINCFKIGSESGIKFFAYDTYKLWLSDNQMHFVTMKEKLLCGAMAGATAQATIYPLEVIKTRMCLRKSNEFSSTFGCVRHLFKQGGISAFYRGYNPNLIGIIPYAGIDLALYETFRSTYRRLYTMESDDIYKVPLPVSLVIGTSSSLCGQIGSYPFIIIKIKMQISGTISNINYGNTVVGVARKIYEQEGVRGFYRGLSANLMKVLPAVSISYGIFEEMRLYLGCNRW